MPWTLTWRADPAAAAIADRHYNRQHVGSPQFTPPGRVLVLTAPGPALWATSWPLPQYVRHAWPGAWVCSIFRREGGELHASELIRAAVAATRATWPTPEQGMVTFINPHLVRRKRDPGRCFLRAGFERVGTTKGGLIALHTAPEAMPDPCPAWGTQAALIEHPQPNGKDGRSTCLT
jgi:hypothetical protein